MLACAVIASFVATITPAKTVVCTNLTGIWHGHPDGVHISRTTISVTQAGTNLTATVVSGPGFKHQDGTYSSKSATVSFPGINHGEAGHVTANSHVQSADPCSAIVWGSVPLPSKGTKFWCKEPSCCSSHS